MESLEKEAKNLFRNLPLIFGVSILTMNAIAFLAPVLAHLGFTSVAHVIYTVYGFLCHQRPWRSIHLFDLQVAWCTRDVWVYLSMGSAAILTRLYRIRGMRWYFALISIVPMALDGGIQLIAEILGILQGEKLFFYASTNFIRMLTASIFGGGVGLWIFSLLDETVEEELEVNSKIKSPPLPESRKNSKVKNLLFFLVILSICVGFYLFIVQLWNITSDKYKPSGVLDHMRYFPGVNYEKVDRCGHCV